MRIGYLVNQYPTPSHSFIRREIQALEALGVEVVRFSIRESKVGIADPEDEKEAAKTHYILGHDEMGLVRSLLTGPWLKTAGRSAVEQAVRLATRGGRPGAHAAYLAEAFHLVRLCEEHRVRHVHVHFGTNSTAVAMMARSLHGPSYSFTSHGPEEYDKADSISLAEKIERAEFVAGVSSFGRSQLWRYTPVRFWNKIHVVRCGLGQDYWSHVPTPVPDVDRLVCVGRLCEQKGQVILLEALGKLAQVGLRPRVVFVGDGDMRRDVEQRAEQLGVSAQIEITGWAAGDRVKQELAQARALVLPSFAEGLPVVIMEAMAMGRPVVSTYVAGIPELVIPNETGWLVPAGHVERLADALRQLLTAPVDRLSAYGASGRERVQAAHDVQRSAETLQKLFAQVL